MISALPLASLALASYEFCLNDLLDKELCLVFKHYFIRCVDFTRIVASNTVGDDVTN